MSTIEHLLERAARLGASDLHVQGMVAPFVRVNGRLSRLTDVDLLNADATGSALLALLPAHAKALLTHQGCAEAVIERPGMGRWRCHLARQGASLAGSFRRLHDEPPALRSLGLPPEVSAIPDLAAGLVLVVGPAGSGRTTTLMALVDAINRGYTRQIITVEDPIELELPCRRSMVSQRAVGEHVADLASGIREALGDSPDVLVVGEVHTPSCARLVVEAAEAGGLVLTSMCAGSPGQAVERLIDGFPTAHQPLVRGTLGRRLQAVVSQVLCRRADGAGRVLAAGILRRSPALAERIRRRLLHEPSGLACDGEGREGSLDDALEALVAQRLITGGEARRHAREPERFSR